MTSPTVEELRKMLLTALPDVGPTLDEFEAAVRRKALLDAADRLMERTSQHSAAAAFLQGMAAPGGGR